MTISTFYTKQIGEYQEDDPLNCYGGGGKTEDEQFEAHFRKARGKF